jgi:UDP:flavonoid glycosyltransferase YjiC (YdhE family)
LRIALLPEGTRGDVQPLLVLAAELARGGHSPVLFGPPDFEALAAGRGVPYQVHGPSVRSFLSGEAAALLQGGFGFVGAARRYMAEAVRRQFELADATQGFDLLIGAGLQFAGPSLGELHGVPYHFVAYTPAILESAAHPPPLAPPQNWPAWANRLSWRAFKRLTVSLVGREFERGRRGLGLPRAVDAYRHLVGESPWLATDPELAPLPDDVPFDARILGFLYDDRGEPLPEKLESFLEAGEPPVYLGFGSMTDPAPAEATRQIAALSEELGCRIVLSRGWADLGEGPLPERVFVTGPVNHGLLFPRMAAVVHHGGAGTTSAVARAGVPQVIVPHVADQFYWGHRVQMAGVSPGVLTRRRFSARRLAPLLREALENEWIADRARVLGERLNENAAVHAQSRRSLFD